MTQIWAGQVVSARTVRVASTLTDHDALQQLAMRANLSHMGIETSEGIIIPPAVLEKAIAEYIKDHPEPMVLECPLEHTATQFSIGIKTVQDLSKP